MERQRADCLELVEREGWELVSDGGGRDTFTDNDVSAYSGKVRPAYQRLVETVRAGAVDVVVSWHPDRLHRSMRELEDWIDLQEATKTKVKTVKAGEYDLSTATGKMIARVLGSVARGESDHKSDRIRRSMLQRAEQGKVHGMLRTYGLRGTRMPDGSHSWELVEDEAAVIREAAARVLAGEGMLSVVNDLNARGVPTLRGHQWARNTLRGILISARICGWREHTPGRQQTDGRQWAGGEFVAEAEWPPIVDKATVVQLRRLLGDPARQRGRSGRTYLLSGGLVRCALCGANLRGRPNHGLRSYYCAPAKFGNASGCGRVSVNAEALEEAVVEHVRDALRDGLGEELAARAEGSGVDDAWAEVSRLRDELAGLSADFGAGTITRAEWMAAREPMTARLAVADADLARRQEHDAVALLVGGLPEWDRRWTIAQEAGLLDQQRALLRAALTGVLVSPALVPGRNSFDPERMAPLWRV